MPGPGVTTTRNKRTAPAWRGDFGGREHIMARPAKLDPNQFTDSQAVKVTLTTNAAQNAVTLAVTALSAAIPANVVLYFGAGKFARTTGLTAAGATAINVQAIPTALVNGDIAYYETRPELHIPGGVLIGRTAAEATNGDAFGPWATGDDDNETFLLYQDITDARTNNDGELYRPGSQVKINYLPGYATLAGGTLTKIKALYQCYMGEG